MDPVDISDDLAADTAAADWRLAVNVNEQAEALFASERLKALRDAQYAASDQFAFRLPSCPHLEAKLLREENESLRRYWGYERGRGEEVAALVQERVVARADKARERAGQMFPLDADYRLYCERADDPPRRSTYPRQPLAHAATATLDRIAHYEAALGALVMAVFDLPLNEEEEADRAALQGLLLGRLWDAKRDFCVFYPLIENPSRRLRLQGKRVWEKLVGANYSLAQYLSPHGGRSHDGDEEGLRKEVDAALTRL